MHTPTTLRLAASAALIALTAPAAVASASAPPTDAAGTVAPEDVGNFDSVGFVLDDGEFRFYAMPDVSWTRIIGIDGDREQALVWWRTAPDTGYSPAMLDLATGEFSELTFDVLDNDWFARGMTADGRIVGGGYRPLADGDERVIYGFLHDPTTGDTVAIERGGSEFTGVSDAAGNIVLGYNDSGMSTFVWRDGRFVDVIGDGANRLLGSAINADGVVVGFASWGDDPLWGPLPRGFVAQPDGDGYTAEPFGIDGTLRTAVLGINDAGTIVGYLNETSGDPMVVFTAALDDPEGSLQRHELPAEVVAVLSTPGTGAATSGVDAQGRVYGTLFLTDPEPALWEDEEICSGHGHLHGADCHCDAGYIPDPDDSAACIPDDAAATAEETTAP